MSHALALNPHISIQFRLSLSLKIFWIIALASIIFLLIFYIFQINFLTQEVYFVKTSENKLQTLTQENKTLEIDFSRVSSLANVDNYLQSQNFVKVSQVKYIKILGSQVAAK